MKKNKNQNAMEIELKEELAAMNRLIDFCLERRFEKERVGQLLEDWRRASGDIIPDILFRAELNKRLGGKK
jgi:hypothetical protein